MFLYNHNSERKNTKLYSLGNNFNYSYGLVVRVATCFMAWGLAKMMHENENQSMDVSWRQSWNEEHHPEKKSRVNCKKVWKPLQARHPTNIVLVFPPCREKESSQELSQWAAIWKRLVLSLLYLEHELLWLLNPWGSQLSGGPSAIFVLKRSHAPGSWHRSCWVQQILDAAGEQPAELSKVLLLGSPRFRLLLLCNEMGSCSQAGNINYFP